MQLQQIRPNEIDVKEIFNHLDIADQTRADYLHYIDKFIRFVYRNGLNHNSLLVYKKYLKNNVHISVSTKNKYLTVAKIYLKELHRLGYIPLDLTANVRTFKQSKKHKKSGLTEKEIQTIADSIIDSDNVRLKAILALLIFQGLRQIEIVRLNVGDIDLIQKTALVQGKGRDDTELIDLHPHTVSIIEHYLKIYKKKSGPLFTSNSNNSRNKRLTTRSIRMMVKKLLKENNIDKCVHGFRHYFTTQLIAQLQDLLLVQEFTRHKSLEMLQIYNDRIRKTEELPNYYSAFEGINF